MSDSRKRHADFISPEPISDKSESVVVDNVKVKALNLKTFLEANYAVSELPRLAKRLGVSTSTIRSWSYGNFPSMKSIGSLVMLARLHEISLEALLLGFEDDNNSQVVLSVPICDEKNFKLTLKVLKQVKG